MKFKVGDKVRRMSDGAIDVVKLTPGTREYDNGGYSSPEQGMVVGKHQWEFQNNWELINTTTMKNAKYMVSWTEDRDPQEFFETKREAEKFIDELIKRPNVKDIMLVELGDKYEVIIPTSYKLELVK